MHFLSHNLVLFSENNYKKQAQFFYQNHSLVLHTVEIFCNLILRNHWTWKISHYLNWLRLILWYIGLGLEKYSNTLLDSYSILLYIQVRLAKF